jgi:hypothetical protein
MLTGAISKEIPYIKKAAMDILRETFPTKETAFFRIDSAIRAYYETEQPEYYQKNRELIGKAIGTIQTAYSQNTFPRMKVTYDVYPEHIGHLESDGCFRCHNNAFKSDNGHVISRDCNMCHNIVGQGTPDKMQYATIRQSLEFSHPVDIGTAWQEANCSECHKYLY